MHRIMRIAKMKCAARTVKQSSRIPDPEQMQALIMKARAEQARAVGGAIRAAFRLIGKWIGKSASRGQARPRGLASLPR
jgi:hypothetical protein